MLIHTVMQVVINALNVNLNQVHDALIRLSESYDAAFMNKAYDNSLLNGVINISVNYGL